MGSKKTSRNTDVKDKKLSKDEKQWFAIAVLLLLLAIFCGILAIFGNTKHLDKNWSTYTNANYGIQFDYPKAWGAPVLVATPAKTGIVYSLNFATSTNRSIIASFSSKDLQTSSCNSNCAYTSTQIEKELKVTPNNYIKSDSSSYTLYVTDKASGINGRMSMSQIVDLTKANVSAVQIDYTKGGSDTCPANSLTSADNTTCITETDYSELNNFAKSIQNL